MVIISFFLGMITCFCILLFWDVGGSEPKNNYPSEKLPEGYEIKTDFFDGYTHYRLYHDGTRIATLGNENTPTSSIMDDALTIAWNREEREMSLKEKTKYIKDYLE